MSFRLRLTVLASLAVAVAVVATSVVIYYWDRHELVREVDNALLSTRDVPPLNGSVAISLNTSGEGKITQGVWVSGKAPSPKELEPGKAVPGTFRVVLPKSSEALQVRVTARPLGVGPLRAPHFANVVLGGVPYRQLTLTLPREKVVISHSLLDLNRNLSHLRWLLVLISLGGIGGAALLGALVAGRATAPLRRLTETTERIVETGDLSERTGQRGRDEISRLSARLDELLSTLEASQRAQRQLVADASHELRTPIATLRANVGLLATPWMIDDRERADLLEDVQAELEAMSTLVSELIELARGEEQDVTPREFRLDEVVQSAVDRAARRAPELVFRTELEPSLVTGVPERVDCAVSNLLDNARKWSPPGETVEVAVRAGLVEVRDRGPGIAAEDVPLVFDRFYRSPAARGMPGAGLGLAIVKQIADAHGGSVGVESAPGGGAVLSLRLTAARAAAVSSTR